ncbi:diguanylate cyclase [Pseudomonas sp. MB-090624]|nr:diguanylate cyclase [Pseudomonas sp. MB-090624]
MHDAAPVGAGEPANTGVAGASHRAGFFAAVRRLDTPAPTQATSRL